MGPFGEHRLVLDLFLVREPELWEDYGDEQRRRALADDRDTGASVASWTDYEVVGKGSIDASVDPSSNGNGGKVSVTNQQPCDASNASQQWQLLDSDLVSAPSRIASAAGGCLALLGGDPDHSEAQRLGITRGRTQSFG